MNVLAFLREERRRSPGLDPTPSVAGHTRCLKATWECSPVTKFKAMTQSLSFLSCSKTRLGPLVSGPALQRHQCSEHSTRLANSRGWLTCFELAVQLLELKAFVAVAVALGVAKVIAGRGPAVLFGRLFGNRLAPVGPGARALAEVLALHAEFLAAAGQDVLAGGSGTLGPGGVLCGSRHVSALARPQLLFCPFCFMESLILSFDEALLTVSFKHSASEGAAFPPQARYSILEPGGCGTGLP